MQPTLRHGRRPNGTRKIATSDFLAEASAGDKAENLV